mmetsp:Transcript_10903/g.21915  ORF Transcript_10903/g.21915 Transcript_10903/m.21915 type:complete len:617 (+) Transcript_10903:185-2035(+)|eukprot:CAMPEP_0181299590 /NCGR_PEP_ID=MMETSP1101-20121128/6431_1 /TAXON_ID=46948 /ORGANISM="Rhodomonas abbreviata, Strain Caron Lab Isolate" /LENGTH=616 /DNA_ID=CAMNT_0023404757 /DNA_START=185 /DNA_END=2035 /DNA_ORIENTATION=+
MADKGKAETQIGEYIPPAPAFPDVKAAKVDHDRKHRPPGLKVSDTLILLVAQMLLMVVYGLYVKQERVPKEPYPEPGRLDQPEIMDMVQPFKRYPPGFDNYFGSERYNEYKVQEHYSSFMQINIFIFLSLPWSFSFLRKFSYSSATFALFTACVSIQFGIIMMQIVDRIHCTFLEGLLTNPGFDISPELLQRLGRDNFNYECQVLRPLDEIEDGFGLRQLRQACYCRTWMEMSQNTTLAFEKPLVAAHSLLVTGHRDFRQASFSLSFMDIIDGMYSTVPTLISFGVLVGKMAPVQNVVLVFMNVISYAFNYWVCVYVIGAFDGTGGAVTTHVFGAFFGAACTAVASPKGAHLDPDCTGRYQSDILSLFGSLMIWAYYPSYNSFYAPPEAQQAVAINTYLALLGSSVAGLTASAIFSGNLKLNIFDAQRSSIAGGVAIGSVANLVAEPYQAILIGAIGGVVCSFSGHFIRTFCVDRLGVHDTVGVMSMHGWPGLVGWLSGVLFLIPINLDYITGDRKSKNLAYELPWENVLQHTAGDGQAAFAQTVIAPMTISIALVTGLVAGSVAKKITHLDRALLFKDDTFFHVPDDFQKTEYHEEMEEVEEEVEEESDEKVAAV